MDKPRIPHRTGPRISVAMSVYNNADFLRPAIDSILGQSFPDFEFLILNDGSTDGSREIIADYAQRDPRVRMIDQANAGLIVSLNRLIDAARGDYIARMDGDDIAMPERFARQVAFLDAHPDFGVIGTSTHDIDDAGRLSENHDYHPLDHASFIANLGDGPLLCHPSVMMRTDIVRGVGGYRRAFAHCEDYDLWLRLATRTRICSLPDRLLHYRRSPSQVSNRHVVTQQIGAAVAWLAYQERLAGRPDPIEGRSVLPPIDQLDAAFGRPGVAQAVRARVAPKLIYSKRALTSEGFGLLLDHVREGGTRTGLWRTAVRLLTFGEPARAATLAAMLAAY